MIMRIGAIVMAALLALYLVFVTQYAIRLVLDPVPAAKVIGVALLVLPVIGAWALVAELLFAVRSQRLMTRLAEAGRLPEEELPLLPSGRPDPAAADAVFPRYQAEAESAPEDWMAWLRLGLAYDAAGDRRRARWATRRAIALTRAG